MPPNTRSVPLRQRLMLVAAAAVLPVVVAAGIALVALVREQARSAEAKSLEVARLAAAAIETEAQRSTATLQGLAASPLIERGEFADYSLLLTRAVAQMRAWESIELAAPDGSVVVHTAVPPGGAMPPIWDRASFDRAVRERRPVAGYLRRGNAENWGVPIRVPVIRDDQVHYVLSAVLSPEALLEVVASQQLPEGWVLSVFDPRNARIVRSVNHAATIGNAPSPSLAALMSSGAREGSGITHSLEGNEIFSAYVRLPFSGWVTALGFPTTTVYAPAARAFAIYGGGTVASLVVALLLASLAAKGINGPIGALRAAAERVGRGEAPAVPATPIAELRSLGDSLVAAAAARGELERERTATLDELMRTRDDLRQQVADLERLHRLSHELLELAGLDAQLEAVLAALCELQGSTQGLLSLATADGRGLRLQAARGFSDAARARLAAVEAGAGACGLALRDDRRVVIEDTEVDPRFETFRDMARSEGFRAVHSTPIRTGAGKVLGVLSVHRRDPHRPTERQVRLADLMAHLSGIFIGRAAAEAEAAASERRLAVALDSSTVPFNILEPVRDSSGTITDFVWRHVNRAGAVMTGRPASELVGRSIGELMPEVWRMPGLFDACTAVAQKAAPVEYEAATPDGARWLHFLATPFEGRVAIWIADVTQRKQQEQALQAADRRKDDFLAILAHELRNPLAPIQQAAMIASAVGATEAQLRWSQDVIVRQVKHMSLLLDDLLDVSRITRGKLELRKTRIGLAEAIDAAVETARPHLESKGHRLALAVPRQPVFLQADPLRVAQVLTNLLTNASRYTDTGGTIELAAHVAGGMAVVSVSDTGIGIAPDQLESIFEMFSRGRASTTHGGGLGIGLALSRGIAHLHGGTLSAASAGLGAGSTFTLRLPLGEVQTAAAPEPSVLPVAGAALRILVADDNRDAAETLASLLRLNGHDIIIAYDGEAAVQRFVEHRPTVVILDIGMPRLSGYEVAQRIRAAADKGAPPTLIAVTGWGQAKDRANAAGAGFDHHLTKPVEVRTLFAILRACSARTGPSRQAREA